MWHGQRKSWVPWLGAECSFLCRRWSGGNECPGAVGVRIYTDTHPGLQNKPLLIPGSPQAPHTHKLSVWERFSALSEHQGLQTKGHICLSTSGNKSGQRFWPCWELSNRGVGKRDLVIISRRLLLINEVFPPFSVWLQAHLGCAFLMFLSELQTSRQHKLEDKNRELQNCFSYQTFFYFISRAFLNHTISMTDTKGIIAVVQLRITETPQISNEEHRIQPQR